MLEWIDGNEYNNDINDIKLGVKFPEDYVETILRYEGAIIVDGAVKVCGSIEGINNLFSFSVQDQGSYIMDYSIQ